MSIEKRHDGVVLNWRDSFFLKFTERCIVTTDFFPIEYTLLVADIIGHCSHHERRKVATIVNSSCEEDVDSEIASDFDEFIASSDSESTDLDEDAMLDE